MSDAEQARRMLDNSDLTVQDVWMRVARVDFGQVLCIGVTREGTLEIINSSMSAERALWLAEWARRWALGLTDCQPETK